MSKATITFDLSNPEDKQNFKRIMKADEMASVLWEIVHNSRKQIESRLEEGKIMDEGDAIDLVYQNISAILEDNNVNIDEIWD